MRTCPSWQILRPRLDHAQNLRIGCAILDSDLDHLRFTGRHELAEPLPAELPPPIDAEVADECPLPRSRVQQQLLAFAQRLQGDEAARIPKPPLTGTFEHILAVGL